LVLPVELVVRESCGGGTADAPDTLGILDAVLSRE
jgi:hypothetical protein